MKRNLIVQILATISIPTGIYAFYRINKLRKGLALYGLSFAIAVLSGVIALFSNGDMFHELASFLLALSTFIIPMVFMREWTIQYNSKIKIVSQF